MQVHVTVGYLIVRTVTSHSAPFPQNSVQNCCCILRVRHPAQVQLLLALKFFRLKISCATMMVSASPAFSARLMNLTR